MDGKWRNGFNVVDFIKNGRYEDLAYILPYTLSATDRACYQKHRLYQEVVNLMNENKDVPPDELDKLIVQRLKHQDRPFMRNISSIPTIC
jgi:hypothetical protein